MREAPLTHEIVLIAQELPLPQRDPADRFLAATAQLAARSSGYARAGQWALEELAGKVVPLSFRSRLPSSEEPSLKIAVQPIAWYCHSVRMESP